MNCRPGLGRRHLSLFLSYPTESPSDLVSPPVLVPSVMGLACSPRHGVAFAPQGPSCHHT